MINAMKKALFTFIILLLLLVSFCVGVRMHALYSAVSVENDHVYIEFMGRTDEYDLCL